MKRNRAGARVLVPDSDLESQGVLNGRSSACAGRVETPLIYGGISRFRSVFEVTPSVKGWAEVSVMTLSSQASMAEDLSPRDVCGATSKCDWETGVCSRKLRRVLPCPETRLPLAVWVGGASEAVRRGGATRALDPDKQVRLARVDRNS